MLKLTGLRKSYGSIRAVDGISFEVNAGDVLGILGPNGAGKSTTLRMAAGILVPDEGSIEIAGYDLATDRANAQAAMGFLPEGAPLYPHMTPLEFLRFVALAHGLESTGLADRIDKVVADVRIGPVCHQAINGLSKGYRRRVALAASILHDPDVLILDEPLDGLDPNQKRSVRAQIGRMAETKAILVSTHTLEEVPNICTRLVIIDKGRIVAEGTPDELAERGGEGGLEACFADLTDFEVT